MHVVVKRVGFSKQKQFPYWSVTMQRQQSWPIVPCTVLPNILRIGSCKQQCLCFVNKNRTQLAALTLWGFEKKAQMAH